MTSPERKYNPADNSPRGAGSAVNKLTETNVLDAMLRTFGNQTAAAQMLNVERSTLSAYLQKHPALKERIQDAEQRMIDMAEHRLMQKVSEGDTKCILFLLERKGRLRGWAKSDGMVENTSNNRDIIKIDDFEIEI